MACGALPIAGSRHAQVRERTMRFSPLSTPSCQDAQHPHSRSASGDVQAARSTRPRKRDVAAFQDAKWAVAPLDRIRLAPTALTHRRARADPARARHRARKASHAKPPAPPPPPNRPPPPALPQMVPHAGSSVMRGSSTPAMRGRTGKDAVTIVNCSSATRSN
mmetsp:Transcript_25997/g.69321  ORF Transcript_25997/g.69321 Transcript_25997/m.69321 type:complete len:163 (-) Transcript_25997:385-873(-)